MRATVLSSPGALQKMRRRPRPLFVSGASRASRGSRGQVLLDDADTSPCPVCITIGMPRL